MRSLPPTTTGATQPGTAPSKLRTWMRATSLTLASSRSGFSTVSTPSGMVAVGSNGSTTGGSVLGGKRRQRAQGQLAGHGQGGRRVDVVAEVDADDADAGDRLGFDQAGPGRLVDPALDAVGDGLLDRGGRHALVVGDDLDGRRLEDRQDVDRDPRQGEEPQHEDHEHDRGHHVRVSERSLDQPHNMLPCVNIPSEIQDAPVMLCLGHGRDQGAEHMCHRGGRHRFDHQGVIPDGEG